MKFIITIVVAVMALITSMVMLSNMSNVTVPAGYAGYIYTKPFFGQSHFKEVLIGQSSTGIKWRTRGALVSVTPYTYPETFDSNGKVLAKDKLPLDANCHIVWKLRSNEESIRTFIEKFGGWDTNADPDTIAQEAYNQFIKEPLRTEIRSVIAQYNGLDVNSNLLEISKVVKNNVQVRLAQTPFEVLDVVMGNAAPPASVVTAISEKVASEQYLLQRNIQLEIANKNILIQTAEGTAEGAKLAAKASEEAKAIASIKAVLTPEYILYQQTQNINGAQRVFVPLNTSIMLNAEAKQ